MNLAARLNGRMRYTRALEDEIARLRAENRALINSILGVAGIPPMRVVAAPPSSNAIAAMETTFRSPGRGKPRPYENRFARGEGGAEAVGPVSRNEEVPRVAPLRRRSWRQIGRALEVEDAKAARRERESDTETFPAPRNVVRRD